MDEQTTNLNSSIASIQEQQIQKIRDFLEPNNYAAIFDIANLSGVSPQQINEILKATNPEDISPSTVNEIYGVVLDASYEKAAEVIMRNNL